MLIGTSKVLKNAYKVNSLIWPYSSTPGPRMGHVLFKNPRSKPKIGPGCYERHWVREEDQSEACILALAILIATSKSEEVPARYMLMLTGTSKIWKKVPPNSI